MNRDGVVIVGGGLAGQRCAETLRARGYEGRIRIVCQEPERPYDRPPLSKRFLAGAMAEGAVSFRGTGWYEDNDVELALGWTAKGLLASERKLVVEGGVELPYEKLLIATGSAARTLPGLAGFRNVHSLRTIADARALQSELRSDARLVVIGAGFIGQEVAATARAAGLEVTILEALPLPLEGVLGRRVARWLVGLHRSQGVDVRLSTRLQGGRGEDRVEELALEGGETLDCDAVLVGIGVEPAARWLSGSGLDPSGVRTDYAGRTIFPHVYAAGDVSRRFDPRVHTPRRAEHWDSASHGGVAAAAAMLGDYPGLPSLPSFWSDQYGCRIQYVGYAEQADHAEIAGDLDGNDFAVRYSAGGLTVGGLAVGRPRDLVRLRREIELTFPQFIETKEEAA